MGVVLLHTVVSAISGFLLAIGLTSIWSSVHTSIYKTKGIQCWPLSETTFLSTLNFCKCSQRRITTARSGKRKILRFTTSYGSGLIAFNLWQLHHEKEREAKLYFIASRTSSWHAKSRGCFLWILSSSSKTPLRSWPAQRKVLRSSFCTCIRVICARSLSASVGNCN